MEFNKNCVRCGDAYIAHSNNARYCKICREVIDRELAEARNAQKRFVRARRRKKEREKPKEGVTEVAGKALAAGMSYGQYVARYGNDNEDSGRN